MLKRLLVTINIAICCVVFFGCSSQAPLNEGQEADTVMTWEEYYDLGMRYLTEGNFEEAIIAFTSAIEIDPNQAVLYVRRGDTYINLGETAETLENARLDYETALGLNEENIDAFLGLAEVYIRLGDYTRAREILQRGMEQTGDERLQAKIDEINSGVVVTSDGKERLSTYYDGNGNLLFKAIHTYIDGLEEITTYDSENNIIAKRKAAGSISDGWTEMPIIHTDTGGIGYVRNTYDEQGNIIEYEDFRPDGEIIQTRRFEYNSNNQEVKEYYIHYNGGNPSPPRIWQYEYDDKGNKSIQYECDLDGNPLYVATEYVYDADGRKVEEWYYYGPNKESPVHDVWEYDQYGNQTKWTSIKNIK